MRLIDADVMIADLEHDVELDANALDNDLVVVGREEIVQFDKDCKENAIDLLRYAPTIDAVEVVRCKDCKHRPSGTGVNHDLEFPHNDYKCPCRCEDYWYSWKPADDWYCANGERRADGRHDQ